MKKSNKFSPEVRERAVRLLLEHRGEYPSVGYHRIDCAQDWLCTANLERMGAQT